MSYLTNVKQLGQLIQKSQHIVIFQPDKPDSDSLLSALALGDALTTLNKMVTLLSINPPERRLMVYPQAKKITHKLPSNYDVGIVVDIGSPVQFKDTLKAYGQKIAKQPLVVIDHHQERQEIIHTTLEIVKPAGATCQQIVEIGQQLNWSFGTDSMQALALGIYTDTLNLTTDTVTPETLSAVKYLLEEGADLEKVRFERESSVAITAHQLPLKIKLLKRAHFYVDNQVAISYMTATESEQDPNSQVRDQVKHDLRELRGIKVAVMIRQSGEMYNCSIRANIEVAAKVAKRLGGGGHPKAAACRLKATSVRQVIDMLIPLLEKELAKT